MSKGRSCRREYARVTFHSNHYVHSYRSGRMQPSCTARRRNLCKYKRIRCALGWQELFHLNQNKFRRVPWHLRPNQVKHNLSCEVQVWPQRLAKQTIEVVAQWIHSPGQSFSTSRRGRNLVVFKLLRRYYWYELTRRTWHQILRYLRPGLVWDFKKVRANRKQCKQCRLHFC